ncbi:MAG: glycosyltransferase [Myxococcaceae bacterium]
MTAEAPELHVVVPVYNEAENFPRFYETLKAAVKTPFRLLVVYDRDEDTTLPVARPLAEKDPLLVLVKNTGKGVLGALKTGVAQPGSTAVLVTMADCSDDLTQVDQMMALFRQGHHVVVASRYMRGGAQRGGPFVKSLLSRLAGLSLHWVGGLPTRDPTNNFKLYSRALLDRVEIESTGGFEIALELTVKAHLLGLSITELPTVWTDRVAGQSNFKLMKWLPRYLRWYTEVFRGRLGLTRRPA